ncbi:MAG: hypothetical protein L3I99_01930 [Sulfurimonas sp.]|nr:hypothetical protein [Sulfurimonas sp.]
MAESVGNIRLEYAQNTLEIWRVDDAGAPMSFALDTMFYVERVDNSSVYTQGSIVFSDVTEDGVTTNRGKLTITINILKTSPLYVAGDELYDHDICEFIHIYSLRSIIDNNVYLAGSVHIYEVAGP